jgi:NitT/TauT family transport system substrate-binding protein
MKRDFKCSLRSAATGLFLLILSACGSEKSLSIAYQYGLAYAPIQLMKEKGFLEARLPEGHIEWVQLANTAAIREAALAGDVDAGFLGIPPFLIARDQGMPWKLLCGLSRAPVGLVAPAGRWASVEDIPAGTQIALPQPGSIQHILLGMALEGAGETADKLDGSLVSLKHPDGMNALLSGAVDAHFTSPPYIFQESDEPGFEILFTGDDAVGGPYTFIAAMVSETLAEDADAVRALRAALDDAIAFLSEHPAESREILARAYGLEEELLADYMARPGLVYHSGIRGLEDFIDFMNRNGMLKKITDSAELKVP